MKRTNLKILGTFLTAMMLLLVACDKDDKTGGGDDPVKPVLDTNFFFDVDGNDVTFTTTLTGTTWVINSASGSQHNLENNEVVVNIPLEGIYEFVCYTLVDGSPVASDPFDVEIEQTDLTFLESGFWKDLTGGPEGGKVWRLDDFMSTGGNEYNKYFSNSLNYYQYFEDTPDDSWGPFGHNLYAGDWTTNFDEYTTVTPGPEIGTISFDGATMTAKLIMEDGVDLSTGLAAAYESETQVVIEVQEEVYGYKTTLEEAYGMTFSDEWATVKFTAPTRMPLDKGRVATGEFTTDGEGTLYNVTIISCTDSAMCVAVERVYEVGGPDVEDNESACTLLYNFICDDYDYTYDDPDAFVAPDRPATSGTLEEGTYKLAEIPGYYYDWSSLAFGNTWETLDAYKMNMAEWWCLGNPAETLADGAFTTEGQARWDAAYSAYTSQTIEVSGSSVTVNYKGIDVWSDTPTALIENTVATTFTAEGGVITFADSISVYCPNAAFTKVKELYIIPDVLSSGIAIGFDNINEASYSYQSQMQNWIKQ